MPHANVHPGGAGRPTTPATPTPFAWLPGGPFTVTLILGLAVLLVAPGGLPLKAHLVLHGLCAQIPGHTFRIGGEPLPFDARMTGIYGGFAFAAIWLVARRRLAAAALPRWPMLALLVLFVAAMGADGTNSLLRDLALPHPYAPHNWLRLVTGTATGITLAAILAWLFADTVWRRPFLDAAAVAGWGDLAQLVGVGALWVAVVLLAPGWLYGALVLLLVGAAVMVVTTIVLVAGCLLGRRAGRYATFADLQRPATMALLIGLLVMALIGGGRLCLEGAVGLPGMVR